MQRPLQLTFHRFLAGEPGRPKVTVNLNNRKLLATDPFHSNHPSTQKEPQEPEKIRIGTEEISIQTFTLPHHKKVTERQWIDTRA